MENTQITSNTRTLQIANFVCKCCDFFYGILIFMFFKTYFNKVIKKNRIARKIKTFFFDFNNFNDSRN